MQCGEWSRHFAGENLCNWVSSKSLLHWKKVPWKSPQKSVKNSVSIYVGENLCKLQKYVALKGEPACCACIQRMSKERENFLHIYRVSKQCWFQIVTFALILESINQLMSGELNPQPYYHSILLSSIKWRKSGRCKWQWLGTVTMVMTIRLSPAMIRVPSRPTIALRWIVEL